MALTDLGGGASPSYQKPTSWNPAEWITSGRDYADSLANWVVKPATSAGIAGFVFDVEAETTVSADTEISDHYSEYNNFFNDHAALRPMEVTMRGFVGELVLKSPQGVAGLISGLQNKLTTLDAILGKYTPQALSKVKGVITKGQNAINQIDNTISRVKNIVGLFVNGSPAPTKQEQAFAKLMALRETRQVFTLVSPYGLLTKYDPIRKKGGPRSFIIKRLVFNQSEESKDLSDIVVTLKEVRFASVSSVSQGQTEQEALQNNSGRSAYQSQAQTCKGNQAGKTAPFGGLFSSFGHVTGGIG